MKVKATIYKPPFRSYTKYELSNFRGSLVQGPSKPDLSGCALPCNNRAKEWRNHVLYCRTRPHTDEDMKKELPKCGPQRVL